MRIHSEEKKFECKVCGKGFKQPQGLNQHMKTHGDANFKCDHVNCGKAFKRKDGLKRHKLTHSGERNYFCTFPGCDKAFVLAFNRDQHVKTHDEEKEFKCEYCDKSYVMKQNLETHMRTHSNDKPFKCPIEGCDHADKQESNLFKHIMRQHNDEYVPLKKEQETKVANALVSAGWKPWTHPELMPPAGHFKREKRVDFRCVDLSDKSCARIDFVLGLATGGYVFLEVDENQHRYGYGSEASCDAKRMSTVMGSLRVETSQAGADMPRVLWLRYNPNAHRIDGALRAVSKKEREAWLCSFVAGLELTEDLAIGYAYYDASGGACDVVGDYPEWVRAVAGRLV
jgi:hypothetical protein